MNVLVISDKKSKEGIVICNDSKATIEELSDAIKRFRLHARKNWETVFYIDSSSLGMFTVQQVAPLFRQWLPSNVELPKEFLDIIDP